MIGRLITRWEDIVGQELALKCHPVKIRYFKKKSPRDKLTASLEIAASSADATVLHYQKTLILERINHIFGDSWITAIRFVPLATSAQDKGPKSVKKNKHLSLEDKKHLTDMVKGIDDPDLQARLKSLGKAILQDKST